MGEALGRQPIEMREVEIVLAAEIGAVGEEGVHVAESGDHAGSDSVQEPSGEWAAVMR